jgi:hypothetical protein
MANRALTARVKTFAQEVGAVIWEGIPVGGAQVKWLEGDIVSFLNKVRRFAPALVYLSPDSNTVAVAVAGVVHVYDAEAFGQAIVDGLAARKVGVFYDSDISQSQSTIRTGGPNVLELDDEDEDEEYDEDDVDGPLSPELNDLAARIASDERFDGFEAESLIAEFAAHTNQDWQFRVEQEAQEIYRAETGSQLEMEARSIVRELVVHPDFDPLVDRFRDDEGPLYMYDALVGRDPRLWSLVVRGLGFETSELGLRDWAEREMKADARRLRRTIPQLVLDQVGFASRRAAWTALLAPFLDSVVERRREVTGDWIRKFEGYAGQVRRETRYAAAAKRLYVGKTTKKAVADQLQIPPAALGRLLNTDVPDGFKFAPEDPIVVELAPELHG